MTRLYWGKRMIDNIDNMKLTQNIFKLQTEVNNLKLVIESKNKKIKELNSIIKLKNEKIGKLHKNILSIEFKKQEKRIKKLVKENDDLEYEILELKEKLTNIKNVFNTILERNNG